MPISSIVGLLILYDKMKVLVSYLGRQQVFSLQETDKTGDLKLKVSIYFGIPSGTHFVLQQFDKEWDTYLDLDEEDIFNDHDRLQVTIITESTPAKAKLDKPDYTELMVNNCIHKATLKY